MKAKWRILGLLPCEWKQVILFGFYGFGLAATAYFLEYFGLTFSGSRIGTSDREWFVRGLTLIVVVPVVTAYVSLLANHLAERLPSKSDD